MIDEIERGCEELGCGELGGGWGFANVRKDNIANFEPSTLNLIHIIICFEPG